MQITLTVSIIDKLMSSAGFLKNHLNYSTRMAIDDKSYNENDTVFFDLTLLSKSECEFLEKLLIDNKYKAKTITTLSNWIKNLSNPNDAIITSLQMLEKTLTSIFKNSKTKWVLKINPDGMLVPCAVGQVKYRARGRDNDACVMLNLQHIAINSSHRWDSEAEIKKEKLSNTVYFYKEDITSITEDEFDDYIFSDKSNDDDDDDDTGNKKKSKPKTPAKKGDFLLSKILNNQNIMLIDDDYLSAYHKDIEKTNHISKMIGGLYTCESKGYVISDSKNGMKSWKNLNDDNKKSKLVVDSIKSAELSYSIQSEGFGSVEVPEHPYILTYDITSFRYAIVHVNNIKPYVYNPMILDKLVISDKKKKILSSLIGSKNNFEDLIQGKSGGIVILSTGESGLGKTLTAEVYSEVMEKPLYCVQSSQLGITVQEIETNLNKILFRAEKWDAVLLIDEADSYIFKRGNDILQNCIVGTFLRLMEYYNGILFLTSNRPDTIDDAIMSRVTLHLKYLLPTYDETVQLWNILCENFGVKIDKHTIDSIWKTYEPFSGRDIRNALKDISKCFPEEKVIDVEMIYELEDFLPFIKKRKELKNPNKQK